MLIKLLFNLLKNLRWIITLVLVASGLFFAYSQYQAIKQSPLGALLPSIVAPTLPSFSVSATPTPPPPTSQKITIATPKGNISYTAELATTDETRALGLMYRASLPQYSGMYFVYDQDVQHGFWMKNCEIPLDMIFIDATGVIIDIRENVRPCKELDPEQRTCQSFVPKLPYRTVLEINGGSAKANGLLVGQAVSVSNL